MKKQILLVTLLLSVSLGTIAQNFKNHDAKVNYLKIPNIIQNSSINTYNVEISGYEDDLNTLGYSAGSITDKLNLRAFTRVDGEGENKVVFRFSGYGSLRGNMSSQTGTDGKAKYFYTYSYTLPMSYEIYAGGKRIAGGEIKKQTAMGSVEQFTYSTSSYATSTDATNNWNSGGQAGLRNQIKTNFDAKFESFLTEVRNQIDYQAIKGSTDFGIFKTTKKEDFTDYEVAAQSAEAALTPLVAGEPRTGLRERMESPMAFWKTKMKTLDPTNKDQDKLYFACANNLANAYYWMDNIDSALYFIAEAEKSKFREGYLVLLKSDIENRRKQLAALKVFGIDPYVGPDQASAAEIKEIEAIAKKERINEEAEIAARIAAEQMKLEPVIEMYDGYIINREDQKVVGKVKCYKANNGDRTGKNYFITEGTEKEMELSASYIKMCEFGSYKYELVKYLGVSKETNLMLVAYDSEKIKVYKYTVPSKTSKYGITNIYYKRPNEELATNTSSLTFTYAYKKTLAKYLEDCPSVSSKALGGEYTDSEEMRIAAAIDYSNCK
jgi:hypothetical protein